MVKIHVFSIILLYKNPLFCERALGIAPRAPYILGFPYQPLKYLTIDLNILIS